MRETVVSQTSRFTKQAGALALAATVACSVLAVPRTAQAEEVTPTAKGITGCALLGGELVVFGEAIFGVRSGTAYLLGAGIGAVAGGVGGYFLEQGVDDGRVPAYTLAGGLALIIPAVVVALDQTRFLPTEGARPDAPSGPPSDPGKPGGSSVIGAEPKPAPGTPAATPPGATPPPATTPPTTPPAGGGGGGKPAPQSLLDVHRGDVRVGMPVPTMKPLFNAAERKKLGIESLALGGQNEVRFPVVHVAF